MSAPADPIAWSKGGEALVLSVEDDRVALRSTRASAPGTPLEGKLGDGTLVRVKVARCRADAGAFRIEGRLIDAPRTLRERLAAAATSTPT